MAVALAEPFDVVEDGGRKPGRFDGEVEVRPDGRDVADERIGGEAERGGEVLGQGRRRDSALLGEAEERESEVGRDTRIGRDQLDQVGRDLAGFEEGRPRLPLEPVQRVFHPGRDLS